MDRDSSIMVRADARAQGAVTALSVGRYSERWKGSGTKSGECVSIFPDGTRVPFVRTRNTQNVAGVVRRVSKNNASSYFDRLAALGADGNIS